ncbi:unnamed protein product [Prunus armeniaca]
MPLSYSATCAHAWVSKAIIHRRKNSESWLKTPTLGITPYFESLLFLDVPQNLTGSGIAISKPAEP